MTLAKRSVPHNRTPALPKRWLVTDHIRRPDPLPAIERLSPGSGVILRHYGSETRRETAEAVMRVARLRRLVVLVAGDWRLAAALGADGLHLPEGLVRRGGPAAALGWLRRRGGILSAACHGRAALGRARVLKAHMAVLSPVFPTASHPGAETIGPVRFGLWARRAGGAVFALGGMSPRRFRRLPKGSAAGFAAVGAFKGS